jgi:predicted  nucleic acid-binding Zn-ribbon protein
MYHKCVKCGKLYEQASEEILSGCLCGSKLFYFVKSKTASKKKTSSETISSEDIEYFYELEDDVNQEIIVFDIESINIKSSGKYELNLDGLMNNKNVNDGLIYKYGEGKYSIDLDNNFKQLKSRK